MGAESFMACASILVNELHWICKNHEPFRCKASNDRILQCRGVLMLVRDHDRISALVRGIERRESFE
jgi:hypothetical protein